MTISVAMATFNGGRFLRAQLDSIRQQSLPPTELVICDDGSIDDTVEIARQFAADAPFKVIVDDHRQRLGFTQNFLRAIGHCTGQIVALCDQDDVWDRQKLEVTIPKFADESVVTVTHRVRVVDERLVPTGLILPPRSFQGRYGRFGVDPWFAPNGMQLLFRRALIVPWLDVPPPFSTYGHGTAPFDEWIYCAGTLVGASVVLGDILGVWRRHDSVASIGLQNVAIDNSAAHQLHLALHSGGEAYAFRAEVTDSRADFAARTVTLADGNAVTVPEGTAFYRRMSQMFRRRKELHDPSSSRFHRLKIMGQMIAQNDYRSRNRGGLGAKAALKDAFTVFFGPRSPVDEAENGATSK